jgi:hypothetical protein
VERNEVYSSAALKASSSTKEFPDMRTPVLLALLILMPAAHADPVRGFCERDGKRLDFTDGIAFADAREGDTVTTTI